MLYRMHKPPPPLAQFVEVMWFYEGEPKPHSRERLLPDGSVELVVNLLENRIPMYGRENLEQCDVLPGSIVCGPHSQFFVIDTASQERVMGIHFKPGGAYPFLGPPCAELQNRHWSLEDLWGRAAIRLRERLLEVPTIEEKFAVMESALYERAGDHLAGDAAVQYALRLFQNTPLSITIGGVTAQIGMTAKRFIERFSREVGLTPKVFCRVRRFQRVIRQIESGKAVDWTDLSGACGYFDQAHFIHDFRAFSGMSPSAYLARRTEHVNHVPLV